jgi:hypothetical protein
MGHALRSSGRAAWMVHVESSRRSSGDQIEDGWVDAMGCVGLYYPYFAVFIVLDRRGIFVFLVFCLGQ